MWCIITEQKETGWVLWEGLVSTISSVFVIKSPESELCTWHFSWSPATGCSYVVKSRPVAVAGVTAPTSGPSRGDPGLSCPLCWLEEDWQEQRWLPHTGWPGCSTDPPAQLHSATWDMETASQLKPLSFWGFLITASHPHPNKYKYGAGVCEAEGTGDRRMFLPSHKILTLWNTECLGMKKK